MLPSLRISFRIFELSSILTAFTLAHKTKLLSPNPPQPTSKNKHDRECQKNLKPTLDAWVKRRKRRRLFKHSSGPV